MRLPCACDAQGIAHGTTAERPPLHLDRKASQLSSRSRVACPQQPELNVVVAFQLCRHVLGIHCIVRVSCYACVKYSYGGTLRHPQGIKQCEQQLFAASKVALTSALFS